MREQEAGLHIPIATVSNDAWRSVQGCRRRLVVAKVVRCLTYLIETQPIMPTDAASPPYALYI